MARRCSVCHKTGHTRRNPIHAGHVGFNKLAAKIERTEHKKHPSYSKKRLERIGKGAAAGVYRARVRAGKGR